MNVTALAGDDAADRVGVPRAAVLIAFTDAVVRRDRDGVEAARGRLRDELGAAATVDAAAVIANFERMTRIADASGIALDPPVNALTTEIQESMGLREFASSAGTKPPSRLTAALAAWAAPLAFRLMPIVMRRVRAKTGRTSGADVGAAG